MPVITQPVRPSDFHLRGTLLALAALLTAGALALLAGTALALPSDRAYEMISPPDKNGGDVGAGAVAGSYRASPDGNALAYLSLGGWGDAPANFFTGAYIGYRGEESWNNYSVMLPALPVQFLGQFRVPAVSADLTHAIATTNIDSDTGQETDNVDGQAYLLDPITKESELIVPEPLAGIAYPTPTPWEIYGSDDFSTVIYSSVMQLTPDAVGSDGRNIYRYEDGTLSLESKLPNGDRVDGPASLPSIGDGVSSASNKASNVVSSSGDVFFFSGSGALYRRDLSEEPAKTELVNVDENSLADPAPDAVWFAGASDDGQIAYFNSFQELVDGDTDGTTGDLYRYDHSKPAGARLTLVSVDNEPNDDESGTGAVLAVTDGGDSVYFTSQSQLVAGESTEPGTKLFHYDGTELHFVALVGSGISPTEAMSSENGEYFAFLSAGSEITPDDNGGFKQAYMYDSASGDLRCASCRPDGHPSTKEAMWNEVSGQQMLADGSRPIRNVSSEGHVFFETPEALLPTDTNGKLDVYVWQDGDLDLISTGHSGDDSRLMDASADGSSVFILTRERLVGWDVDNNLDAYVARTGEVYPAGPAISTPCSGDDCQSDAPEVPEVVEPGSSDYTGPGNPVSGRPDCSAREGKAKAAKRKARGQVRKVKTLRKRARRATGKRAERLRKRVKRARRSVHRAQRQTKRAQRQARSCRNGR